jgi:hypothetical protein
MFQSYVFLFMRSENPSYESNETIMFDSNDLLKTETTILSCPGTVLIRPIQMESVFGTWALVISSLLDF